MHLFQNLIGNSIKYSGPYARAFSSGRRSQGPSSFCVSCKIMAYLFPCRIALARRFL